MSDIDPVGAQYELNAIATLEGHPGWRYYCARAKEIREKEIEAKIFDPATDAAEREVLVRARKLLVDSYTPEKVIGSLQVALRTEVTRRDNSRNHNQS